MTFHEEQARRCDHMHAGAVVKTMSGRIGIVRRTALRKFHEIGFRRVAFVEFPGQDAREEWQARYLLLVSAS